MSRDRDRDRDSSPPFFLSKVNNKVLTNIGTLLMLSAVYTTFQASVNKFLSDIQDLYEPQNTPKNGAYTLFFSKIYYFALLIKELIWMISHFEDWAEKSCSPQGRRFLVETYVRDIKPSISKVALLAFVDIFFYYSTNDEFFTSIEELGKVIGYKKTKTGEILQELETLNSILKRRNQYFSSDDSLIIQLINIEPLSIFLRDKPLKFLATYVKMETLHVKGLSFKAAVFKDVHDLDNIITIKVDRVSYDDETSGFLKKLNAGDVISFTPSINKPTIKGIKYPLNLKMHSKAETEDDITFFGKFTGIEDKVHEKFGLQKSTWFKDIQNISNSDCPKVAWLQFKPDCLNSKALEKLEEGDDVVFKATVVRNLSEGKDKAFLKDIRNIRPRHEFYDN